jgi:hypothetical protein
MMMSDTQLSSWMRFVATIGIPGILAFALLWIFYSAIPVLTRELVRSNEINLNSNLVVARDHADIKLAQTVIIEQLKEAAERNRYLFERICRNTAETDADLEACHRQ